MGFENIEIKARVTDTDGLISRIVALDGVRGPTRLDQVDTFFHCTQGRLKLRCEQSPNCPTPPAKLIHYDRTDQSGPKSSLFEISPIPEPDSLKEVLSRAMGVHSEVRKTRILYLVGQTRIHVDQVEGLGDFMELEVQMCPGDTREGGEKMANDLMVALGIGKQDLITCAYTDLLQAK